MSIQKQVDDLLARMIPEEIPKKSNADRAKAIQKSQTNQSKIDTLLKQIKQAFLVVFKTKVLACMKGVKKVF